jgi:hypothetical protein
MPVSGGGSGVAEGGEPPYDEGMNSVTKEVLDARLETIETRMDGRISTLEAKIDSKFADLKADIHKGTAELVKWVVGTAIAMAAVALTVMTFVLNNAIPKAPAAPPAPPAIYYVQPVSPPAVVAPPAAPNKKP